MHYRSLGTPALAAMLLVLAACVQKPIVPSEQPQPPQPEIVQPQVPRIDPLADVPGDKPLPVAQGAVERIDCMSGAEDLHARMALEARGGRVESFAYYSKWKPRTCAFDFARTTPGTKWRLTPDGAMRVHTPQGRFLIRAQADAYVFEFEQVQRNRFCGMPGEINGTMIVRRGTSTPQCSVRGIMDTNDTYLDALYKNRIK
jgi:hypothetical protein